MAVGTPGEHPSESSADDVAGPFEAEALPAAFHAADRFSLAGQRRHLALVRVRIVLAVLAAVGGALSWGDSPDWGGVLAATAFAAFLATEFLAVQVRPDRDWYEGRALAESVKAVAWQFAVGGRPFMATRDADEAADDYLRVIGALTRGLQGAQALAVGTSSIMVTPRMRQVRSRALEQRKDLYREERLEVQLSWYAEKARHNRKRSTQFVFALVFFEFFGLGAGVLRAAGTVDIDLLGIVAALVAGIVGWTHARQFGTLSVAYATAAQEIRDILARPFRRMDEAEWSTFVQEAESAISREHKLWAARRASGDTA